MPTPPQRLPRLLRRRLFVVMLAAGLLPLIAWGVLGHAATSGFLSLSLEPLVSLLARADAELQKRAGEPELREDLRQAQLNLGQAELMRRSLLRFAPWLFGGLLVASSALLAFAAARLGRAVSRPIEQVTHAMLRHASGDHGFRVLETQARRPDELQYLVRRFNAMSDELDAQRRRLQTTEKLLAWQDVARVLAHDLKNPLTAMRMAMGRLARSPHAELREPLELMQQEIDVLIRMTQSFAAFAALPAPALRPLDLAPLLEEVCALYRNESPVTIEPVAGDGAQVNADPDQLRRAFSNLVKNAVEASRAGEGPIRVELRARPDERVEVSISDGGTGIPESLDADALLAVRRSSKPGGSGLGLAICHKIVHDHGGALRLERLSDKGTRAIVTLPRRRELGPAEGPRAAHAGERDREAGSGQPEGAPSEETGPAKTTQLKRGEFDGGAL
jgi:nitrogen fixation/metabolism regulation signal transduction histidine kinase